jgi:hypothetical protein
MPARRHEHREPRWWQLYLGLPLLCGLFLVEMRLHVSGTEDTVLQLGILGLIFLFVRAWIHANRRALMEMDMEAVEREGGWQARVFQFPPAEPANGARSPTVSKPTIQFPEGELRGILGTDFEMEYPESLRYVDDREVAVRKD